MTESKMYLRILFLLAVFENPLLPVNLSAAERKIPRVDQLENCAELVAAGKCTTDLKNMQQNCNKSCLEWSEKELKYKPVVLESSFYDLYATPAVDTKSKINFERFEGYYTLIIPLAKTCSGKVSPKTMFESISKTKEMFSYGLEIVVFPYKHPSMNYDQSDCSEFDALTLEKNTKLHIVEESSLSGKDIHPVFSYFLNAMDIKEFDLATLFYFIVNPDGDLAMYHYDKSLKDLQVALRQYMKTLGMKEL